MSSKDYFLSTKEAKKATKRYKELLKGQDLSLRIENGEKHNEHFPEDHYELTFIISEKYNQHKRRFRISTNSKNVIFFRSWSDFTKDFLKETIDYAVELSKALGAAVLIFDVHGEQQEMLRSIDGVQTLPIRNALDIKYITTYMEGDEFVYKDIKDQFVGEQLAVFYNVKNYLELKKQQDSTFQADIASDDKDKRTYVYYMNGLRNTFTLHLHGENIFKDDFFNETVHIKQPKDVNKALDELFERVQNETKFPSLINPPKHYFETYFFEKFYRKKQLIADVFNLLMEHVEPQEIEASFATSPEEVYKKLNEKERLMIISIYSIFFVLDFTNGEIDKYTNLEKATLKYEQKATSALYNVYLKEVNKLKRELKNITIEQ